MYPEIKIHEYVIDKVVNTVCIFDTPLEAIVCAREYYFKHGKVYPYHIYLGAFVHVDAYNNVVKVADIENGLKTVESQVMEF